tara:strand:- start:15 stop:776 length:762 start_codon:yes stop_codon:yes gene_type:complete
MSFLSTSLLSALVVAAFGNPTAPAQTTGDWDFFADPARNLTVASVDYSSGVSLTVHCLSGALTAGIRGLSDVAPSSLLFDRQRNSGSVEVSLWRPTPAGDGLINTSARDARSFRQGGTLALAANPQSDSPLRIQLDLPSQSANLDRVLGACGLALVNPIDDAPDASDVVVQVPRLEIPDPVARRYDGIQVELDCLIANARLTACQSERQLPADPAAGALTARAANGTRVRVTDAAAAEGRRLTVVVTGARNSR